MKRRNIVRYIGIALGVFTLVANIQYALLDYGMHENSLGWQLIAQTNGTDGGGSTDGGETTLDGGSPCEFKLGHSSNIIKGGEMKKETTTIGSFTVGVGHTANVNGKIIVVGAQYTIGSTITMQAIDYICRKCLFGTAWCGSCNSADDHRGLIPCK